MKTITIKRWCWKKIDAMLWHANLTICWLILCQDQFLKNLLNLLEKKSGKKEERIERKRNQREKERPLDLTADTNQFGVLKEPHYVMLITQISTIST